MAKHGRYKIVRKVADGGMAEIFLATQIGREGFQKPVILKRIHTSIYADPQFRNMFIDEAHISMSLSHSNIVQVLDLGLGGGRYFLAMELVDGWDLGRILNRATAAETPLPRELGLYVIAEVCRALAYAHGKTEDGKPLGIVHRDVSPHNVLVSEQGEVKLTDFGIAKAMNKREQTGTGVVKGKVAFMSPEQALGKGIDARSDLFSLGTLMYQMATGVRPFEAPTDLEILLRVQKAEFRPAVEVKGNVEPELARILQRAMRLEPADRYQTADEMLVDVEHVLRTVYRPVGQTELKRWLADLQRKDGVASIGKSLATSQAPRTGSGSGELEGKDVVLSEPADEEVGTEEVGAEDNTAMAVVGRNSLVRARPTRQRMTAPEHLLPVPDDGEGELGAARSSESELALPVVTDGDTEAPPPVRRRRRGIGRGLTILLVGVLLIAAAAVGGSYFGSRAGVDPGAHSVEGGEPARGGMPPVIIGEPPKPSPPVKAPVPSPIAAAPSGGEPAKSPPSMAAPTHEPAPPRDPAAPGAKKPRPPSADRPEHKPRAMIELRNMMQPDPSQLPAAPPAGAPTEPPAPPPPKASEGTEAPAPANPESPPATP